MYIKSPALATMNISKALIFIFVQMLKEGGLINYLNTVGSIKTCLFTLLVVYNIKLINTNIYRDFCFTITHMLFCVILYLLTQRYKSQLIFLTTTFTYCEV